MPSVAAQEITCPGCGAGNQQVGNLIPLVCRLCGAYLRRNSLVQGDWVRFRDFPENGEFQVTGVYVVVAVDSELNDRVWVTLRRDGKRIGRVESSAVQRVRTT
jgi:hypothetical protein